MPKKPKKRVSALPATTKAVFRRDVLPDAETSDHRLCWRFTHFDHDGPWGFGRFEKDTLQWLLECLRSFESMTPAEIFRGYPGKLYEVAAIPNKTALDRLDELGMADMTTIWRLRLGGEPRLYGFLAGHVFHVLWWDPDHEIWPSTLKHT